MSSGYQWFALSFRNSKSGATKDVRFNIESDPLSQRWAGYLRNLLNSKALLQKKGLLLGWPSSVRDLSFLCTELNGYIKIINDYYGKKKGALYYHIPWVFKPETVDQELLNLIHHDFEILVGPTWKISKRFAAANASMRYYMLQLNILCHEIESVLEARKSQGQGYANGYIIGSILPKVRHLLTAEESKRSQLFFNFGDVHLNYCQLGKTHFESFRVQDQIIDRACVSEVRYISGEFDICFGGDVDPGYQKERTSAFRQWLQENQFDLEGSYGFPRVAKLDRSFFLSNEPREMLKDLFSYDDVYAISICHDGQVITKEFNYAISDSDIGAPKDFTWKALLHPLFLFDRIRALYLNLVLS